MLRIDRGHRLEDFAFAVDMDGRSATLPPREGFVTDEFIDLARTECRTSVQEARLDGLTAQLTAHVTGTAVPGVFDVE